MRNSATPPFAGVVQNLGLRAVAVCMAVAVTTACVSGPEQNNRLCPCSEGWVCAEERCVKTELVCPGTCGDGVVCPGEACDDGDTNNCTIECNATCTGPAAPHQIVCVPPEIFFADPARLEVSELPPSSPIESESYTILVHSSNPYYRDITVNFGTSHDLNEGTLRITPDSGRVVIAAGDTASGPIELELQRDATPKGVRHVYVALLAANAGEVGAPSLFTLFVRNALVPEILGTTPEDGAVFVQADTTIEVEFSLAMDTVATTAAWSIDPPVEGDFTWEQDDQLLVFTPAAPLDPQEIYFVALGADATSAAGVPTFEYGFTFETFGPRDVALIMTLLHVLQ